MAETKVNLELLACTPNPEALIYASFRQCYHKGFVGEMWPRLLSGEISQARQAEFIKEIIKSGHNSPIEHVQLTFAVEGVSRALTHQLVRHRVASYSQQSQRYVDGSNFNYILPPAIAGNAVAKQRFEACLGDIQAAYQEIRTALIEAGRSATQASEDARFVLPQAAETRIVLSMNCRSLLNFFEHRCCTRAQWEIRILAAKMLKLAKQAVPVIFDSAGAKCESLGYCPEGAKFTCGKYPLPPVSMLPPENFNDWEQPDQSNED